MNIKDKSAEQTGNCHPMFRNAPSSVAFKKLRKRLLRQMREALGDFSMVEPNETPKAKWLICLSGGKDSYGLLALLADLKWRGLLPVELLEIGRAHV